MTMASEIEPSQYPKYRVRLVNPLYGFLTVTKLWGEWLYLDQWMEYIGERLRKKHGERRWALRIAYASRLTRYEIEGITEDGRRVALSRWRLKELGRESPATRFKDVDAIAAELQGIPGLGEGEIAYHLREHEGLSPALTIRVMRRLGYEDVDAMNVPKKRGYGGERIRRGLACGACEPDKSGRQRNKRELAG